MSRAAAPREPAGGWRALATAMEVFSSELRSWDAGASGPPDAAVERAHRDGLRKILGRSARAFDAIQSRLDAELSRLERDFSQADAEMNRTLDVIEDLHAGVGGLLPGVIEVLQQRLLSIQAAWHRLIRHDSRSRLERARVARVWRELRDGVLPALTAATQGSPGGLQSRPDARGEAPRG